MDGDGEEEVEDDEGGRLHTTAQHQHTSAKMKMRTRCEHMMRCNVMNGD